MSLLSRCVGIVGMMALVSLTACTNCGPGAYNVTVSMDPSMREAGGGMRSVEVNLVGVNDTEAPRWTSYSMTSYFTQGDPMYQGAEKKVMSFGRGLPERQTLAMKDEIWQTWSKAGAKQLFVLVFLPGMHKDEEGTRDPRRMILPLNTCRWDGKEIQINVKPSGANLLTPMLPEKD